MYHLDLGFFGYILDYTQKLLVEQCGKWAIEEFNNQLVAIPRFPGLKIFKNGITVVQIADEHRIVIKVIILIVDGLFDKKDQQIRKSGNQFISSVRLTSVYWSFVQMYLMSCKEDFSDNDLVVFEVYIRFIKY